MQDLNIEKNKLNKIIFGSEVPLLQKLNISDNQLIEITGLINVKRLSHLNISKNNLTTLGHEFASLQMLEFLDASYNSIKSVEIGRLKSLKQLILAKNKIENINFLNGNEMLESINLSENLIAIIPELYGLLSLKQLILK